MLCCAHARFSKMSNNSDEVWCEVSDDELYNPGKSKKGTWEPKAEDILKVFQQLKDKKVLELHWTCPGRRPPDSDEKEVEVKEEQITTPSKAEEKKPSVPNEFDFDDDDFGGTKTVLTPRRTPGSAPKSQKKEARMDKILKDMMQQRKLQAAEREARKLASGSKSPRTPASPGRARVGSPAGSPRTPNRQSPVRIGAAPGDPIGTTPLRPPLESVTSSRLPKSDTSLTANNTQQTIESPSVSVTFHQNIHTSQTDTTVPGVTGYQSQSQAGETNVQQTISREAITASQQLVNQQRKTPPTAEGKEGTPAILKTDMSEKMDTN